MSHYYVVDYFHCFLNQVPKPISHKLNFIPSKLVERTQRQC